MLFDQIQKDLVVAQKAKDEITVSTLRMVISNLNNARIAKGSDLVDDDVVSELAKDAKRHKESIAAFEAGARADLVEKEKAELTVLSKYLPEQITEEELTKVVDQVFEEVHPGGMSDMGKVMSAVMAKVGKTADGSMVSSLVSKKLSSL